MVSNDGETLAEVGSKKSPDRDSGRCRDDRALALFQKESDLVDVIARQLFRAINGLVEFEELVSAGREGLFDAASRFDESQGVPFRAYANYRVRGAMMDAVRKASWLPRRNQERLRALQAAGHICEGAISYVFSSLEALSTENGAQQSLDEHLAAATTAAAASAESWDGSSIDDDASAHLDPEESYARKEMLELIRDELGSLNVAEAHVIRLLYFEHQSLDEAATALNRQKPWACRLQTRGIDQLTKRLKRHL